MEKVCLYCGKIFETTSSCRRYCSVRCRRDYQNARRKDERAELRDAKEAGKPMVDPWEAHYLPGEVTANALFDEGMAMWDGAIDMIQYYHDRMDDLYNSPLPEEPEAKGVQAMHPLPRKRTGKKDRRMKYRMPGQLRKLRRR